MVGWAASAAVLATFCVNTMMPLRVLAIISNVLFCAYGAVAHIFPVLILHAILLPVNVVRLVQIRRLVHGMQAAENSELSVPSLLPFMSGIRPVNRSKVPKLSSGEWCLLAGQTRQIEIPSRENLYEIMLDVAGLDATFDTRN